MRDALLSAAGCDRTAGYLAYWEWQELQHMLAAARERIHPHTDAPGTIDAEHWANHPARTVEEVLTALDAAGKEGDIEAPSRVTLRPWCKPKIVGTCRIPFIPLAATAQAWAAHDGTWWDIVDRFGLAASMTSWDVLEVIEPGIRNAPTANVHEAAIALRAWMGQQTDIASPIKWMFAVCDDGPRLAELIERAEQAREP